MARAACPSSRGRSARPRASCFGAGAIRALATMAALLMLALSGGMAGITWKWREADRERNQAEA